MRFVDGRLLLALSSALVAITGLPGAKAQSSYEPECVAWDKTISQIKQSLNTIGGSATCTKSADCTGLSCTLKFWGKQLTIDVKLYPCDIPAQMRLRVRSPTGNINFEQSVTHGDSYNLPGFQYSPFRLMPAFKLAVVLVVHFEKVAEGLRVGLRLETRGFGSALGWPLMPDTIVPTPPCPTAMPSQCVKMDQLLSTMATPQGFVCLPTDNCHGFSCAGTIGLLGILTYDLNATLVVNSCANPISYTVHLISKEARLNYVHTFTHSDTVPVKSPGMPPGSSANLTVTMSPSLNLDSIDTSIKIDLCIAPLVFLNPREECHSAPILTHQPVPIPPCEAPLPTAGAPLPALGKPPTTGKDAECDAWEEIERGLTHAQVSGYGFESCHTNLNCMGLTCLAIYDGNTYELYMELFHCAHPVTLLVRVDSAETNFHYAQNITQNSTLPINEDLTINVVMFPVKNGVLLGGSITSTALAGIPLTIPVIPERVVPTPACPGVTSQPVQPAGKPTSRPIPPVKTKVPSRTSKPGGKNPNFLGDSTPNYDDEAPKQDPLKQGGVNGVVVGVAVGFAAIFTILVLGTIYYFSRRHNRFRGADEVVLVGDGGTSVA